MIINKLKAFFNLTRPANGLMAISGVLLGSWLSSNTHDIKSLLFLSLAAIISLSFGNVINDIVDIDGDKINHPDRPLPKGLINIKEAYLFLCFLALLALIFALMVSTTHFFITLIPLILLLFYTLWFKGLPLVGNFVVSLLVAYTLIYGALGAVHFQAILLPALLAFILNFEREVIKDIQDKAGDLNTGIKTTASLPPTIIKLLFIILCSAYIIILPLPFFTPYFSEPYLYFSMLIVLPIHIYISLALLNIRKDVSAKKISKMIKIEMLLGLSSLALDKIL